MLTCVECDLILYLLARNAHFDRHVGPHTTVFDKHVEEATQVQPTRVGRTDRWKPQKLQISGQFPQLAPQVGAFRVFATPMGEPVF